MFAFPRTLPINAISVAPSLSLPDFVSPLATRHSFTPSIEGPLPLESTFTSQLRVSAEISRSCPSASSLESTLTDLGSVTALEATLAKKTGVGEGGYPIDAAACLIRWASSDMKEVSSSFDFQLSTVNSLLRPPMQRRRSIHRVRHRRARPSRLQQVRLQREIPLRRAVRVIDQHQSGVMFQPFRLLDHGLLVLPQELLRKNPEHPHRQEYVPGRDKINTAEIPPHRSNRGPARKPKMPAANLLESHVGQHEIDHRGRRLPGKITQNLVRRAVRRRLVFAHPEPIRNRLELLFLLMNAVPAPPEPRLMHKRPMRRIHKPDNSVIDVRRQLTGQMRDLVSLAKHRQRRRGRNRLLRLRTRRIVAPNAPARRHVHPNVAVALLTGIMPRKDALHFQFVLAGKRRNFQTAPAASIELPPVITTLQRLPVKMSIRERNPPMRAGITHGKRLSVRRPPQNQRHLQKHRLRQPPADNLITPDRRIPKIPKEPKFGLAPSLPRRLRTQVCLQNGSHRFAHVRRCCRGHLLFTLRNEGRRAARIQPHRSIACCISAIAKRIVLRESKFGAILGTEQIDVRHLLLADSLQRSNPGAPLSIFTSHESPITSHFS